MNVFTIALMTSTHCEVGWSFQEFCFVIFTLENTGTSVAVKFAAVTVQLDIINISVNACISDNLFLGAHEIAGFCSRTEPPRGCWTNYHGWWRVLKKSVASNCRKNLTSCFCLSTASVLSVVPKLHSCMFLTGCNCHFLILYGYFYEITITLRYDWLKAKTQLFIWCSYHQKYFFEVRIHLKTIFPLSFEHSLQN